MLKQEAVNVVVELMQAQDPGTAPEDLRGQAHQIFDAEIAKIREAFPEFLILSAETEEKLRAGTPIGDAANRIADAGNFFNEFGLQLSGLVQFLLPQHKVGSLSPIRTELLAQLMVADKKKAEKALSN